MPPTPEGPSYIRVTGGPYKFGDEVTYEWNVGEKLTGGEDAVVAMQAYQDKNEDGVVETNQASGDIVYAAPLEKADGKIYVGHPNPDLITTEWKDRGGPAICRIDLCIYGWKGKQQSIRVLDSDEFPCAGP